MEITLHGDTVALVLARIRRNRRLVRSLAEELVRKLDLAPLARLLLDQSVALELLQQRLRSRPRRTVNELRQLTATAAPRARVDRKQSVAPARRRRHRLSRAQGELLKQRVISFLRQHPWSNRGRITEGAGIPTLAIYNRLMAELKRSRQVVARGQKSKAVYAAGTGRRGRPRREA